MSDTFTAMTPVPFGVTPEWGDASYMFNLSGQMVQKADTYLQQLGSAAAGIFPPVINPSFPTVSAAPAASILPMPTLQNVGWSTPLPPTPFTGTLDTTNLLPAPFTGVAPTLNFGTAPSAFSGPTPDAPPIDLNFAYPSVSVSLPAPPDLMAIDSVVFSAPVIPTFSANVPVMSLVAPSVISYVEGSLYTSALLTQVKTDLTAALTAGEWTGLPPAVEQGLWDRGRERELRSQADALADLDRMEVLGYALPPGIWLDARIKIQTETQNTTAGLSREIMIKQAELNLENIIKARGDAVTLESKMIDYANMVAQRTFEASKYVTEAMVAVYNAEVQAYKAQLDAFQTQATIYDAQIKGALASVDVLKARIEYEHTKAEINNSLVNQYKVEVDAALANIEIFKAEVQVIETQANIEKIKVEVYGAQIQAYTGQINAYTAQVEGYKASIQAQATVESAYKTSVEAYTAQVEAGAKVSEVRIEQYKGQIQAYTAQLEGYKASIEAMVGQARAAGEYNTATAEVYRAEVSGLSSYNELLTKQWQAAIDEGTRVAEVAVKAAEANGQLYISARQLSIDASKVGAQVVAQLGAASLNAIHWSNSSSWTASSSASNSQSASYSTSNSTSTNTNYNL